MKVKKSLVKKSSFLIHKKTNLVQGLSVLNSKKPVTQYLLGINEPKKSKLRKFKQSKSKKSRKKERSRPTKTTRRLKSI